MKAGGRKAMPGAEKAARGERVRRLRMLRGWTQEMLAQRAGRPAFVRASVAKIETGDNAATTADVQADLARAFGLDRHTIALVLDGTVEPENVPPGAATATGTGPHEPLPSPPARRTVSADDALEEILAGPWWEPAALPSPALAVQIASEARDERNKGATGLSRVYWGQYLRDRLQQLRRPSKVVESSIAEDAWTDDALDDFRGGAAALRRGAVVPTLPPPPDEKPPPKASVKDKPRALKAR